MTLSNLPLSGGVRAKLTWPDQPISRNINVGDVKLRQKEHWIICRMCIAPTITPLYVE